MLPWIGRFGFVVVLLLCLVGLQSAVGRLVLAIRVLDDPVVATAAADDVPPDFNDRYFRQPWLTLVHSVSGIAFMTLGPLQFVAGIRERWPRWHRIVGRVFLVASLASVATALAFVALLPVYGTLTASAGTLAGSLAFVFALQKAYRAVMRRQFAAHREWMIRLFAIGLGISTFRLLIPILMSAPLNASFPEAWDTVVWLGFLLNAAVAEAWIHATRGPSVHRRAVVAGSSAG